jgi:catechol 2,3-dioxygenase-like lactoylglutathione lyase family enzyme
VTGRSEQKGKPAVSAPGPRPISFVEVNVRDLDVSLDFYRSLLDLSPLSPPERSGDRRRAMLAAGPVAVRLTEVGRDAEAGDWVTDDLQRGFRHVGLKVDDVDARAARVRAAGVPFHLEPTDAVGGVRIAFFRDPDGLLLEFVQGNVEYHRVWNEGLVVAERGLPVPAAPRFDHVAVTVEDLDRTLAFYRESLGFDVIGQLVHEADPRGFLITYLGAVDTILEVFSYTAEKSGPSRPGDDTPGFRAVGFAPVDSEETVARLQNVGAKDSGAAPDGAWRRFLDADGLPLTVAGTR